MQNNFYFIGNFSNIYKNPSKRSEVTSQIIYGEKFKILAKNKNFLDKANIYYRINRLIDKKQMGELFKVIYIYKKNNRFNLGFK